MRATFTIDNDKLDSLMKEKKSKSKASAVKIAIDEYLKRKKIEKIKKAMQKASQQMDFMEAARLRDEMFKLQERL